MAINVVASAWRGSILGRHDSFSPSHNPSRRRHGWLCYIRPPLFPAFCPGSSIADRDGGFCLAWFLFGLSRFFPAFAPPWRDSATFDPPCSLVSWPCSAMVTRANALIRHHVWINGCLPRFRVGRKQGSGPVQRSDHIGAVFPRQAKTVEKDIAGLRANPGSHVGTSKI